MLTDSNNGVREPFMEEDEFSIPWGEIIARLWKGRVLIIAVSAVFAVIGLVAALTMTRSYQASVVLAPEMSGARNSATNVAAMLGVGGLSMGGGNDAYSVTTYPDVIASTPFLIDLFSARVVDPRKDVDTTLVGYLTTPKGLLSKIFPPKKKEVDRDDPDFFREDFVDIDVFRLTPREKLMVQNLQKRITADVNQKTGITSITVTMDNPFVAAIVADSVVNKLCTYITSYRTGKAQADLEYYQKLEQESLDAYIAASNEFASFQDNNRGLISNAAMVEGSRLQNKLSVATQVYTQMAQQTAMAKAKVQEETPVIAVIEPASVPVKACNSRKKVLLLWTFAGFALACLWVGYLRDFFVSSRRLFRDFQ